MKTNSNETKPDKVICESCGEDFTCGANAEKCWCFEVKLSDKTLKDFRENYKNCLCPNCLEKFRKTEKLNVINL